MEKEKAVKDKVFIYALKRGTKFRYVGQTVDLKARHTKHKGRRFGLRFRLVVLRESTPDNAARLETQIIQRLKRRGECDLNKVQAGVRPSYSGMCVKYQGVVYPSEAAAVRAAGCSGPYEFRKYHAAEYLGQIPRSMLTKKPPNPAAFALLTT